MGELTWALAVKLVALFLIWLVFFSQPLDRSAIESHLSGVLFGSGPITHPVAGTGQ